MNNKASSILQNAKALLLTASAALCLCLLTGCSHEELPETGKYNVSVKIDTKTIDPSEVGSIVIYAFADTDGSGNEKLVGYLNEKVSGTDTDGIFNMTLWSRGEDGYVDFYVLLNYDSEGFKICDTNGTEIDFNAQTYSPHDIKSWTVHRSDPDNVLSDVSAWKVPMSNLEETQPTGGSPEPNRSFYLEDIQGWQVIPIEVTRAVSKVEVWFWSNDLLIGNHPNDQAYYYNSIVSQTLTDPITKSDLFRKTDNIPGKGNNIENNKTYNAYGLGPRNNVGFLAGEYFPVYDPNTYFYSSDYFKLIWEQYILPNTLFGGNIYGETDATADQSKMTMLEIGYENYTQTRSYVQPSWPWQDGYYNYTWPDTPTKTNTSTIYLPKSPRNTKVVVWCGLGKDVDPSFNYLVVEWDETVTIEVPEFD